MNYSYGDFEIRINDFIKKKLQLNLQLLFFCGKEGIRTLEALLTLIRFPGEPLQPLEHLSKDDFVRFFFSAPSP